MEQQELLKAEVERQRKLIATLQKRIQTLQQELEACRRKILNVWGDE